MREKIFIIIAVLMLPVMLMGSFNQNDGHMKAIEESMIATASGVAVDDTAAGVAVVGWTYVGNWPNWTAYIKNAGGGSADDFVDVWVEGSPDGTLAISLSTAESSLEQEANTLASGAGGVAMMGSNQSLMYIRIMAKCDTDEDTTADGWISVNRN